MPIVHRRTVRRILTTLRHILCQQNYAVLNRELITIWPHSHMFDHIVCCSVSPNWDRYTLYRHKRDSCLVCSFKRGKKASATKGSKRRAERTQGNSDFQFICRSRSKSFSFHLQCTCGCVCVPANIPFILSRALFFLYDFRVQCCVEVSLPGICMLLTLSVCVWCENRKRSQGE